MAEARSRLEWAQTSSLLALLYNIHRKPRSRALRPSHFDPHAEARQKKEPVIKVDMAMLKGVFTGKQTVDQALRAIESDAGAAG
jgi:hypothetical protein